MIALVLNKECKIAIESYDVGVSYVVHQLEFIMVVLIHDITSFPLAMVSYTCVNSCR